MRKLFYLLAALWLIGCAPTPTPRSLTLITENGQAQTLVTQAESVSAALAEAQLSLPKQADILLNGHFVSPDARLDCQSCTLQIRPAETITLIKASDAVNLSNPAFTTEERITASGLRPAFGDAIQSAPRRVTWQPGQSVRVQSAQGEVRFPSSAENIAAALASAGIAPQGLDDIQPPLSAPLSAENAIQLVRVQENLTLDAKLLPFETIKQPDNTLEVDQQAVLQNGEYGLALQRTRIRLEDGQEAHRLEEASRLIRAPQEQIIAYGTRIALHTLNTPYGNLQYWRALQMYATSYSPCRSAADRCYYNTASGVPVQHGVVAMLRSWYLALRGMRVYIPGYGIASIEDVGGGFPDGRPWIDLGYSDDDYQIWSGWVTVYFLAPAPAEIPWMLR